MFRMQLVSLVLATIFTGSVLAQPAPILFTQQAGRNDNLFLLTTDGELRQITDHHRKDSSPSVSPDGRTIAFTSERVGWWKIWTMDIESGSVRQLTESGSAEYSPTWSPTGDEIAFVSTRDGNAEIYVMAKDGSNLRNITNSPSDDETPFWGRDGRIYYATTVMGVSQLASIKPDGTDKAVITTTSGNKYMPQVSPDGASILYYGDADGNPEIYTMQLSDEGVKRLTRDPLQDIRGRWSPDGKEIVFERGDKKSNQQIFVMDKDGGRVRQTTSSGYNYAPVFVANCSLLCSFGDSME